MRVTIQDVARHANVSPMTVSRVANESPHVSPETRRRVEAAIQELGYVPNRLAQSLIRRRTKAIGLIVPDVANPFFTLLVRGAEDVAWRSGYHVILSNTQADLERERGYVEDMLAFRVDGILIAPVGDRSRSNLQLLTRNAVPLVLVDRSVAGFRADVVQGDSVAGAERLVQHLVSLGHRRIGMVTEGLEVSTSRDRVAGYRRALEAAGVDAEPELVAVGASATDPRTGHDGALTLLDLPEPPTAILAVNNVLAIGVVEAARERRLEVPQDLAVVCFDDIEHVSRLYPFLTVMAQPAQTFGTLAMQLLLDRISGGGEAHPQTVVLPAEFTVRASCGAGSRPAPAQPVA